MDWKKISADAKVWANKAKVAANTALLTGKEFAEKAKTQSYETLVNGSLSLSTKEEFESLKDQKRLAIFCIRETDESTKKMLLLFPVVFTKAWIESGAIRIAWDAPEVHEILEIRNTPSLFLFSNGECTKKIEEESEILDYMKNFTFYT